MKNLVLSNLIIIASIVIVISFFMPWAKVSTSVTGVSKELTSIVKDKLDVLPFAEKAVGELEKVTGAIAALGDIKIKKTVSGYSIPVMVNNKTSKVAFSLAQVMFKSTSNLDLKSYLVYLLPIFGIGCAILSVLGLKNRIYILIMLVISGAVSIAGLYILKTADLSGLVVSITIERGLWYSMYGFLFIFVVGIAWLVLNRSR